MVEEEEAGSAPGSGGRGGGRLGAKPWRRRRRSHPHEKEKKWGIRVRVGGILVFI
jgi:hypothetical protein